VISVLAPSRGRSAALQEMADQAHETAESAVEVLAYVDVDDPADYESLHGVVVHRGPRTTLSDCWNVLAGKARGDVLQMGSDDIRHRTPGWDTQVRAVFESCPDRLLFVYTRDGIHDDRLGTHGFVSREWVETVGYFTPSMFPADYADTWLNEVSGRVGRRAYLSSVLIEHLHPIARKAEWDQTHRERLQRREDADVDQLWIDTQPLRDEAVEKLRVVL
jgi:hypothetical protein